VTDAVLTRSPEEGGLRFARFVQLVRTAARASEREEQAEWERAAFIGWQNVRAWGYEGSFPEWVAAVGLKREEAAPEVTAEEARAIGERIRELDRHKA
jgi:hypothetical protein